MKDLLNRKQLAEYFNVDPATINTWRNKGLPYIKLATGRVVYNLEDVENWILGK